MLTDPEDRSIVESVIRMAAAFNREVIAEGVETLEIGTALIRLGCPMAQGYGVAKPMSATALIGWAQHWQQAARWRDL